MEAQAAEERTTLQALMRASKLSPRGFVQRRAVLYEYVLMKHLYVLHAAAVLETYKECVIDIAGRLLATVKPGNPYDHIERLQLFHPSRVVDLTYLEILSNGNWNSVVSKRLLTDTAQDLSSRWMLEEEWAVVCGGNRFEDLVYDEAAVLPKLKAVVLGGGLGRHSDWAEDEDSKNSRPVSFAKRVAPLALLDLPTVGSMCQSHLWGPLSLPGYNIKAAGPVRIVTHHLRPSHIPYPTASEQLPMVIGAVNRLYFSKPFVIDSARLETASATDLAQLLMPFTLALFPL